VQGWGGIVGEGKGMGMGIGISEGRERRGSGGLRG